MRSKLVVGNWKSNGSRLSNQQLLDHLLKRRASAGAAECAVCVPFPFLFQAQQTLSGSAVSWGAQDVSPYGSGAYTGAVTGEMIAEFGSRYVIVGHSECRGLFGDTDDIVAAKFEAARAAGLIPILCVGESLQEHDAGATHRVVGKQLSAVIAKAGIAAFAGAVIAYEPVWAIGTGKSATPQQAQDVHAYIRGRIAALDATIAGDLLILYGGSVKASNAAQLFTMDDIDGGLIGGASLVASEFVEICNAAEPRGKTLAK
jgi:triosephosphate isomerase (TIM)